MPDARCPHCHRWTPREQWEPHPPGSFPFTITCPKCAIASDAGEVDFRMAVTPPRPPPPPGNVERG